MADYDSDSSGAEDVETNVLLGYASKEPTGDEFSQLGGHPIWLDSNTPPSGALAKCKVCNGLMSLLVQLNGELHEKFPGHERRLYIWACRRKACRRKEGSVRGFRATRRTAVDKPSNENNPPAQSEQRTKLGETLFGVKPTSSASANPFSTSGSSFAQANPFASASSVAAKPPQKPSDPNPTPTESLPSTFADKARIANTMYPEPAAAPIPPYEPWPDTTDFPPPHPSSFIDADKEYIDAEPAAPPTQNLRIEQENDGQASSSCSSAGEDKLAFESTMDKAFQRFADRFAQNPEQILRYDYAGDPLLYSKTDAVGKLLSPPPANPNANVQTSSAFGKRPGFMPRCKNCGAERVFEMQLTPHAITELEAEDLYVDGMDWGTVILGTCREDCQEKGKDEGEVGYVEEWVGVQWEELTSDKRMA